MPVPPVSDPPPGTGAPASPEREPAVTEGLGREALRDAYRDMLRIRRFEEKAGQLFGLGEITGSCHLYIGQEAIASGIARVRMPADRTLCAYRSHGHYLSCGGDLTALMSELCGRACGVSGGKGGSVHLFWPEGGFYGGHGVIGANAPLAAGLALAGCLRDTSSLTWCILGDRAIDQGQVAETFVLAQRLSLPVVFVIEDNSTLSTEVAGAATTEAARRLPDLANRGIGAGLRGEVADGMDVEAVVAAAGRVSGRVRADKTPELLVLSTERYRGHSLSRPGKYQDLERGSAKPRPDPLVRARDRLLIQSVQESELRDIDRAVRDEINAAAAFALADSEPSPDQLTTDISGKGRARMTAYRRVHGEPSAPDTARGAKPR